MDPFVACLAVLAAVTAGLAYYRFVVMPAEFESKMQESARAFGRAVELRFPNHCGLTDLVNRHARRLAKKLGFGPKRTIQLEMATRLRDIGLCAIPYNLVNKRPWLEWSASETHTYDCHAEVGGAILETIPALRPYAPMVREHHAPFAPVLGEPDRRLPKIEARIIKVCAEYVWHSRHRGEKTAREHLEQGKGSKYDPQLVDLLLGL
jgi:response regulator RpfG family c-di-GMP phosphodiesterase